MTESKQRHGCLTTWLIFTIVVSLAIAVPYFFGSSMLTEQYPKAPGWGFPALGVVGIVNLVGAIALFKWKKWGFWLFCVSAIATAVLNYVVGLGPVSAVLSGIVGVAILFGVLHIGKTNKGWPQLE
jgi:hypothetical protein